MCNITDPWSARQWLDIARKYFSHGGSCACRLCMDSRRMIARFPSTATFNYDSPVIVKQDKSFYLNATLSGVRYSFDLETGKHKEL